LLLQFYPKSEKKTLQQYKMECCVIFNHECVITYGSELAVIDGGEGRILKGK
jgi:hypothetical protein